MKVIQDQPAELPSFGGSLGCMVYQEDHPWRRPRKPRPRGAVLNDFMPVVQEQNGVVEVRNLFDVLGGDDENLRID